MKYRLGLGLGMLGLSSLAFVDVAFAESGFFVGADGKAAYPELLALSLDIKDIEVNLGYKAMMGPRFSIAVAATSGFVAGDKESPNGTALTVIQSAPFFKFGGSRDVSVMPSVILNPEASIPIELFGQLAWQQQKFSYNAASNTDYGDPPEWQSGRLKGYYLGVGAEVPIRPNMSAYISFATRWSHEMKSDDLSGIDTSIISANIGPPNSPNYPNPPYSSDIYALGVRYYLPSFK